MALAQAALSEAASESCWSLADQQVLAALGAALAVRSDTEAVTASLVGQAESRGGGPSWRRPAPRGGCAGFQVSPREAHRITSLAQLVPRWLGVAAALAAGRVGVEAAAVITGVSELATTTSGAELIRAEELLTTQAERLTRGSWPAVAGPDRGVDGDPGYR